MLGLFWSSAEGIRFLVIEGGGWEIVEFFVGLFLLLVGCVFLGFLRIYCWLFFLIWVCFFFVRSCCFFFRICL